MLFIDPEIVQDCITRLRGLADSVGSSTTTDAKCASRYLTDNVQIPMDDSVGNYPTFRANVAKIPPLLSPKYDTLYARLSAASDTVATFTSALESLDRQHAENMDSQVVNRYNGPDLPSLPTTSATPGAWVNPADELTPPSEQSPNDLFYQLVSILGIGGVGDAVAALIENLPGIPDLLTNLEQTFGGNWNDAYRCSDALNKLSKFAASLGDEMNDARLTVGTGWEGDAAETFNDWMLRLTASADEFVTPLAQAASDAANVASGMQASGNATATILTTIGILIIAAVAELLAAPETLGASLIAEGITVAAITACIADVAVICTATGLLVDALNVSIGLIGDISLLDGVPVPEPYNVPLTFF